MNSDLINRLTMLGNIYLSLKYFFYEKNINPLYINIIIVIEKLKNKI